MTKLIKCRCTCFDNKPCEALADQEDLLCEECRVWEQSCKAVKTSPIPTSSSTHCSAEITNGGKHTTWAAYSTRGWGPSDSMESMKMDVMAPDIAVTRFSGHKLREDTL